MWAVCKKVLRNTQLDNDSVVPTACLMHDAYDLLPTFALGQLCAWPSVAWLGTHLSQTTIAASFSPEVMTWSAVLWGIVCGITVSSGYLLYFKASESVPATVAFSFSACNPLISIFIDGFGGKFRDFTRSQWSYLAASVALYGLAIGLLSQCLG